MSARKILLVFGTRPETIKMAPVVRALAAEGGDFDVNICVTAQHRDMLDPILNFFDIVPDYDLNIMEPDQTLADLTARALTGLGAVLAEARPERVLVQGDTTTTFAASLAAYYRRIPVAHIEAGLRTHDIYAPWPEEVNRRGVSAIADLHFVPTEGARENLLNENIPADRIHLTGNTVIDALRHTVGKIEADDDLRRRLAERFPFVRSGRRIILVTGHRRESLGPAFERICRALRRIVEEHDDVELVYPVHSNPNVRETVQRFLGVVEGKSAGRIHLSDPIDYLPFVFLLRHCHFVMTDSGGLQEEAPSLAKPVLILRRVTERPEVVEAGAAILVGTDEEAIVSSARKLLADSVHYRAMSETRNPYGDGRSAARIVNALRKVMCK